MKIFHPNNPDFEIKIKKKEFENYKQNGWKEVGKFLVRIPKNLEHTKDFQVGDILTYINVKSSITARCIISHFYQGGGTSSIYIPGVTSTLVVSVYGVGTRYYEVAEAELYTSNFKWKKFDKDGRLISKRNVVFV